MCKCLVRVYAIRFHVFRLLVPSSVPCAHRRTPYEAIMKWRRTETTLYLPFCNAIFSLKTRNGFSTSFLHFSSTE